MGAAGAVAGVQMVGKYQEAKAIEAAAEHNAKVSRRNATISLQQSEANAAAQSRDSRKVLGTMQADYGASGVTTDGSVLDVIEESASLAELDRQNILYSGRLAAMGFEEEASIYDAQGSQAMQNFMFDSATSVLTASTKPKAAPPTTSET